MEDIFFNEEEHRYYDADGNNYTSVTTLIGKYTNTFDTDFWSMYTALKDKNVKVKPSPEKQVIYVNGIPNPLKSLKKDVLFSKWQAETLAKWDTLTTEACIRGNNTHNKLEDTINASKGDFKGITNQLITPNKKEGISFQHELDNTTLQTDFPFVYDRLSGYVQRGFSIFAEKRVFLQKYKIAGMIDVPLMFQKYFAILDWKTNKNELHRTAGYYKKVKVGGIFVKSDTWVETGECFKYPLDSLEASKFNIYSLQLSLYAYILEQWGYTLLDNGLEIIHFPLDSPPLLLKIPYLKQEVEIMLNHHYQTNILSNDTFSFPNV